VYCKGSIKPEITTFKWHKIRPFLMIVVKDFLSHKLKYHIHINQFD